MSTTEDSNQHKREGSQLTASERLLCLQSDIEGQGRWVAMALKPITEALDNGENVSREMMSYLKVQILKAHLQLDDLKQVLDSIK